MSFDAVRPLTRPAHESMGADRRGPALRVVAARAERDG